MKKLKKQIQILLLLCLLFICSACENCDDVKYHRTVGVGYIMVYDDDGNLQPVPKGGISVRSNLGYDAGLFSPSSPEENFTTDETGKFQVRFIKRNRCRDAKSYYLSATAGLGSNYGSSGSYFSISLEYIKNAPNNVLLLDTIKYKKRY